DQGTRDLVDRAIEGVDRHPFEPVGKSPLQQRIEMPPEREAARDDDLPQPGLALMQAGRYTAPKRRAFERGAHPLLVERVAGFVDGREQRLGDVVLVDAGGNPHVAARKRRAERMVRQVLASAREVVAHPPGDAEAEVELLRRAELAV